MPPMPPGPPGPPAGAAGFCWWRPCASRTVAGGFRTCRLLFADTRARVDRTMAPDSVLATRHAALGAPRRRH